MERDRAIEILERLQSAQNEFYAGGSGAMLMQLLTADIPWTVPGNNRIAGTYRGRLSRSPWNFAVAIR
jgi:hypothetical protein